MTTAPDASTEAEGAGEPPELDEGDGAGDAEADAA